LTYIITTLTTCVILHILPGYSGAVDFMTYFSLVSGAYITCRQLVQSELPQTTLASHGNSRHGSISTAHHLEKTECRLIRL